MNVGTLTISLAARTAALTAASARVKSFETGVVASAQRMNRSLLMLGQTFSALTIPIAALGVTATKMFSDFEFELAKVEGLVGIAGAKVQQWGDSILKMASDVGRMPRELGEALYFVTSAGIRGAETMDVLRVSARAAAAGLGETKSVADAITSAMNAYGKENLSAANAADILTMAVREGKVVAEDLASSIGKVFPVAAQLEVSFNEVGAAIAAMTRTGTPASTSAIYLRRVLTSMLRPTQAAESAMYGMGDSFYNLRNLLQQDGGLLKALLRIKDLVNSFGVEQVSEVFPNIRALIPVLDIIGKNLEDNKKIWENMLNPVGALDRATKAVSKTFKQQWNEAIAELQTSIVRLGQTLGATLIPVIQDLIGLVTKAVNWWTNLSASTQQMVARTTLLIAVIGPLTVIIGGLGNTVLNLVGVVTSLARVFASLTAAAAPTIAIILAVLAVIVALPIAAKSLKESWGNMAESFRLTWLKIKLSFLKGKGLIFQVLDKIEQYIAKKINFITNLFGLEPIIPKDFGANVEETLIEIGKTATEIANLEKELAENGGSFAQNFEKNWVSTLDRVKDKAKDAFSGISDFISNLISGISGFGRAGSGLVELPSIAPDFGNQLQKQLSGLDAFKGMGAASPYDMPNIKLWKKYYTQIDQINKQYAKYGNLVDIAGEKQKALDELLETLKKRGVPISDGDLSRLKELNLELNGLAETQELVGNMSSIFGNIKSFIEEAFGTSPVTEFFQAILDGISMFNSLLSIIEAFRGVQELLGNSYLAQTGSILANTEAVATNAATKLAANSTMTASNTALSASSASLAVSGALAASAWVPFPGNLAAMGSSVAGVMAGLATIPEAAAMTAVGLKDGGIIPGGFEGDKFPAMLNSGEAVIPLDRLPQMLGVNQNDGKKIVLTIDGRQLVGVMEKQEKAYNAF